MAQLKSLLLVILSFPMINVIVRFVVIPIKWAIPTNYLVRIPVVGKISVQYPNLEKFVMIADGRDTISSRIYWQGVEGYEKGEITVYLALLSQAQIVFDIGANVGLYSLIAACHPKPQHIYTFEPMPAVANVLHQNILVNQINNVSVHEIAVTDLNGEITFHIPIQPTYPVGSSINEDFRANSRAIIVQAVTLDTFVEQHNVGKVDLLKIDTESTEPDVLRGATHIINRDRPLIMCEILRKEPQQAITDFVVHLDYLVFRIEQNGVRQLENIEIQPDATNFLLIPSEKREQVPSKLIL